MFNDVRVLIRGAGDLATGVAARLWRAGFRVALTELAQPLTVRRTVAFSEAVYEGETTVEELAARRVESAAQIETAWRENVIPVIVDPEARSIAVLRPRVVIDAILAKCNLGTRIDAAPLVIGLGPGFTAGQDVHAVVETKRGHYLGRVLWQGSAQPDTGVPGEVQGIGQERVIYSPADGVFQHRQVTPLPVPRTPLRGVSAVKRRRAARRKGVLGIGARVNQGDVVGLVGQTPVAAPVSGIVRGLIHDGVRVQAHVKIGDIDPRGDVDYCSTISDKALAVGGGVLEAILIHLRVQ